MIIARYTRPYQDIDEGIPADYFELTAVVSEGREIMKAEKYFSSKIYVLTCTQCDSTELDFLGNNSVMCHRCQNVMNINLGSKIPVT